jgi:hypothetical protein
MTPGKLDLRAYRWTPFVYALEFPGYDFSAADFALQVRAYRDATGGALVNLTTQVNPAAQGVSVSVETVEGVSTSLLQIRINETTIEGLLPLATSGRPSDDPDVPLVWDLHITTSGLGKRRWLEGSFTIMAGVTQ